MKVILALLFLVLPIFAQDSRDFELLATGGGYALFLDTKHIYHNEAKVKFTVAFGKIVNETEDTFEIQSPVFSTFEGNCDTKKVKQTSIYNLKGEQLKGPALGIEKQAKKGEMIDLVLDKACEDTSSGLSAEI